MNFSTALGRLRIIGLIEGISAVLLFCVAMPWKRLDPPTGAPVQYAVGMAHGLLWMVYIVAVLFAWRARRWGLGRAFVAAAVSIPPFGTLIFDRWLKREQDGIHPIASDRAA